MDKDSFRLLRKQYKLTQEAIGKKLPPGYSRFAVNAWETGKANLPPDIMQKLAAADLLAPASKADTTRLIGHKTHPQCWLASMAGHAGIYYTLAHPRWYISSDNPVLAKVPKEHSVGTTVAEFNNYKPVAPESVFKWLMELGAPKAGAQQFMLNRGYTQFGEPQRDPLLVAQQAFFTMDRQDATMEDFYLAFPQFKPQHTAPDPQAVAEIGAKLEDIIKE